MSIPLIVLTVAIVTYTLNIFLVAWLICVVEQNDGIREPSVWLIDVRDDAAMTWLVGLGPISSIFILCSLLFHWAHIKGKE